MNKEYVLEKLAVYGGDSRVMYAIAKRAARVMNAENLTKEEALTKIMPKVKKQIESMVDNGLATNNRLPYGSRRQEQLSQNLSDVLDRMYNRRPSGLRDETREFTTERMQEPLNNLIDLAIRRKVTS